MHRVIEAVCTVAVCVGVISGAWAASPLGELPRDSAGRLLNFDFETGTLDNWTASGEAFAGQPVKGDTVTARGRGMKSEHTGRYWVGGYEVSLSDAPQGALTSARSRSRSPTPAFALPAAQTPPRASSWCAAIRIR